MPAGVLQQILGSGAQIKYMGTQTGSRLGAACQKAGLTVSNVSLKPFIPWHTVVIFTVPTEEMYWIWVSL